MAGPNDLTTKHEAHRCGSMSITSNETWTPALDKRGIPVRIA